MERYLIHGAVVHRQATHISTDISPSIWTRYCVACQWFTALCIKCSSIWKQVMEIYRQSRNRLYWWDAHAYRMRYIAQPYIQVNTIRTYAKCTVIPSKKKKRLKLTAAYLKHLVLPAKLFTSYPWGKKWLLAIKCPLILQVLNPARCFTLERKIATPMFFFSH